MLIGAGTAEAAASLLELGLVFAGIALLGRLAGRFGLSPIPLYLVAGLFIGEGSPFQLEASDQFIEVASTLGVVLLLFFLGLEYSADELLGNLRTSAPAGAVDLLNAVPGVAMGLLLGWSPTSAVVLGGITYISSSGVIAKVLADLGRLGNRETPTILAVLVIEDLVMAVYLPVVAGLVAGGAAMAVVGNVAVGLVLVAVVMAVAVRYGERLSALVFSRSDEVVLFSILAVTFLIAGGAEHLGVSAGVGAFLVGIALSGPAQQRAERLVSPLRDLFAAAFFLFFTYQIDPADLGRTLVPALALAVVGAATKVATGYWAAARSGVGVPARWRTGLTLVARGEFSIVIAGLAVANGAEEDLGTLAATFVLLLAVAGPLVARSSGRLRMPRLPFRATG